MSSESNTLMVFDNEEELKEEPMKYNIYYNKYIKYSSLKGRTPKKYRKIMKEK